MSKYNLMFDVCFTVDSDTLEPTAEQLIKALEKRLNDLKASGDEICEAVGQPIDVVENES